MLAVMETKDPAGVEVDVDVTLIDEMLRRSPLERIRDNDRFVQMVEALQDAVARDAARTSRR